jgi:hypothetical protein
MRAFALIWIALEVLAAFPGGTIFMAAMCSSKRLDGWDWVFSVIVPFYGMIKSFFFC